MKPAGSRSLALLGAQPRLTEPCPVNRPVAPRDGGFLMRVQRILDRRVFTNNGPCVRELEARLAAYIGVRDCVLVANATLALELLARVLGLRGEVIVPSYTFIATAHAFRSQGLRPVFCDVEPDSMNLSVEHCRQLLGDRTAALCGVHLWGRAAAVEALQALADSAGVPLLFDAAHAFGSRLGARVLGSFGRAEVFSLHATKIFHSMEGGAICTNDSALAEALRRSRNFGFVDYDDVGSLGTNAKLCEMSAAFGLAMLDQLDETLQRSRAVYRAYSTALQDIPGLSLIEYDETQHNCQYAVLRVDAQKLGLSRDQLMRALHAEGIIARRYFTPGCHRSMPYRDEPGGAVCLPVTEALCERVLVIPAGAALTEPEFDAIVATLHAAAERAVELRVAMDICP